jgi:hypothetical protein
MMLMLVRVIVIVVVVVFMVVFGHKVLRDVSLPSTSRARP